MPTVMSASTDISCVSMTVNKNYSYQQFKLNELSIFFREIVPVRIRILGKHVI